GVFHRRAVGQVGLHVGVARMVLEARQPRLLQGDVVVVVEVVEADDLVAARQQHLRDMTADEAGSAGDENLHAKYPETESRNDTRAHRRGHDTPGSLALERGARSPHPAPPGRTIRGIAHTLE